MRVTVFCRQLLVGNGADQSFIWLAGGLGIVQAGPDKIDETCPIRVEVAEKGYRLIIPAGAPSHLPPSVHAKYSRLSVVIVIRLPNGSATQAAADGSNPLQMHSPNTPSAIPRSALPMGPSTRREPPIIGPSMPATSLATVSTTIAPTQTGVNGPTNANGSNNTTSETTSPTSVRMPRKRRFCPKSMASVPSMVAQAILTRSQTGSRPKSALWL